MIRIPDIRLRVLNGNSNAFNSPQDNEVCFVPNLFTDMGTDVIDKLIREVGYDTGFSSWHNDTHWIANDARFNKNVASTFNSIIDRLCAFFRVTPSATRLNYYETPSEFKPYHHDASAFSTKSRHQNVTLAVSFGAARDFSLIHVDSGVKVDVNLFHGAVYTFGNDINLQWKHAVMPGGRVDQHGDHRRVSIIIWGWVSR